VLSLVHANGFEIVYEDTTVSWQDLVYKRVNGLSPFAGKSTLAQV
jgi:hypothetical protein